MKLARVTGPETSPSNVATEGALPWIAPRTALPVVVALLLGLFSLPSDAIPGVHAADTDDRPPLLLVSMDGFRWDYMGRVDTPNLDRLAVAGVRADGLVPVFPSKTFPSHYSIVTGLYPGHHGILFNNMRDPRWQEEFHLSARDQVRAGRWWGGEPIWVTAETQGRVAASLFWPGSEAPVDGVRPTHWRPYDPGMSHEARVDRALEWLESPDGGDPALIALYFEEPDEAGHRHGPDSPEVDRAIVAMDRIIGRLLAGLPRRGLGESVNLVVVSDHGMAATRRERTVVLDDHVDVRREEVFEQGGVLQLFPAPGRVDRVYRALRGAHPRLTVYRPGETPPRYRLHDHPRLPPILGVPDAGWEVMTRRRLDALGDEFPRGGHGQDPRHREMHGIFLAAGPAFASGLRVPRFEAVEVYNLLARALGVEPASNDGDLSRVSQVLAETLRPARSP